MVSAAMALWLKVRIPFQPQRFIRSKNYQIGNTGVSSLNKNTNVLKNIHLGKPSGKKLTLFFSKNPTIPIPVWWCLNFSNFSLTWCLIGA